MDTNILIVDDEAHIRLLIEQALEELEDEGATIMTAENGLDALEMIKDHCPALVFLDVMMPQMNGFDVCNTVKNDWGFKDIYIVMLTAKGQEFDKQRGEAAGADLYMTKPFDPDELLQKAIEVMRQ
ncbi:MAG: response regulator [Chloroflexota bacterium]|nr:MAG: response regulator [Chloroflexota bacterium]